MRGGSSAVSRPRRRRRRRRRHCEERSTTNIGERPRRKRTAQEAQIPARQVRPPRDRDAGLKPGFLDRSLSPVDDGLLAGVFRRAALVFVAAQCRFRLPLFARPRADRQCQQRPHSAGVFLLLHRDAGDGRLRRHASADQLRASHRHHRNLHRHVFPRGDDRIGLRPVLAAARPLRLRRPPGRHRRAMASST